MLYLVGLGLGDAKDITVKGLEIVRRAKLVFLEAYTSILGVGKEALVSRLLYSCGFCASTDCLLFPNYGTDQEQYFPF